MLGPVQTRVICRLCPMLIWRQACAACVLKCSSQAGVGAVRGQFAEEVKQVSGSDSKEERLEYECGK